MIFEYPFSLIVNNNSDFPTVHLTLNDAIKHAENLQAIEARIVDRRSREVVWSRG